MSALIYTPSALLEGKLYSSRSRGIEGIIQEATIQPQIWYGENTHAYRVRVRPTYTGNSISLNRWKDFYAVVAVRVEA
jgi:hypothetical protein